MRLLALLRLTESSFLLPSRGDMYFYNDWAQRILHGQWTEHVAFYGLPGYAFLLAGFYAVFGYGPFVPTFFQACLDAGTATLLYKISERVFAEETGGAVGSGGAKESPFAPGRMIGWIAAIGWALFVPAQAYSVILMPTAWLVFVFWFVVWRVVQTERPPGLGACLAYGTLVGLMATGIATVFFVLPLLVVAIFCRGAAPLARKFVCVLLLFFGVIVGTSPCWLHNYVSARDPVFLSAHSGINFWIGNNPAANGYPRIPPGLRAGQSAMLQDSIKVAEAAAGRPLKRSEVSRFWSEKARSYIAKNPKAWLRLVGTKLRNFWNAFSYDDLSIVTSLREERVILPGPRFGLVAALALPGMIFAWRKWRRARWITAAILLHMASLLTVFVTERYRLAAVPGLLIFAGFTLWRMFDSCASRQWRNAGLLVASIAVSTCFVSIPQADPALWALDAYNSGWQALEAKNLLLAQKKLELAYAYVPENAEINLALGNLWVEEGEPGKAEKFYRATLRLDPDHKSALSNLGVLALQQNRPTEAEELFRHASKVEPGNAKTHYLLARALWAGGKRETALQEIQAALQIQPEQPEFAQLRDEIEPQTAAGP